MIGSVSMNSTPAQICSGLALRQAAWRGLLTGNAPIRWVVNTRWVAHGRRLPGSLRGSLGSCISLWSQSGLLGLIVRLRILRLNPQMPGGCRGGTVAKGAHDAASPPADPRCRPV